jgi:hypothetical protein
VNGEGIDQDLAAGAGRVRHGRVVLIGFACKAFYVSAENTAFEITTLNFRFVAACGVVDKQRLYASRMAYGKYFFSD